MKPRLPASAGSLFGILHKSTPSEPPPLREAMAALQAPSDPAHAGAGVSFADAEQDLAAARATATRSPFLQGALSDASVTGTLTKRLHLSHVLVAGLLVSNLYQAYEHAQMAKTPRAIPFVINRDCVNQTVSVHPAEKVVMPGEDLTIGLLSEWVGHFRHVAAERQVDEPYRDWVFARVAQGSDAAEKVLLHYADIDKRRLETATTEVVNVDVSPLNGTREGAARDPSSAAYNVRWLERTRRRHQSQAEEVVYAGTVRVSFGKVQTEDDLRANPEGFFITHLSYLKAGQ
ncbi:MAG TPA: type IV secretion system protein [Polyangiales bacterium]|nr:type IV secretion system protein [Polyangiales bacterium]